MVRVGILNRLNLYIHIIDYLSLFLESLSICCIGLMIADEKSLRFIRQTLVN